MYYGCCTHMWLTGTSVSSPFYCYSLHTFCLRKIAYVRTSAFTWLTVYRTTLRRSVRRLAGGGFRWEAPPQTQLSLKVARWIYVNGDCRNTQQGGLARSTARVHSPALANISTR